MFMISANIPQKVLRQASVFFNPNQCKKCENMKEVTNQIMQWQSQKGQKSTASYMGLNGIAIQLVTQKGVVKFLIFCIFLNSLVQLKPDKISRVKYLFWMHQNWKSFLQPTAEKNNYSALLICRSFTHENECQMCLSKNTVD